MGGGNFLGDLINGHPMEAMGNDSKIAKLIDGQPGALFQGGDKSNPAQPAPAQPAVLPVQIPMANPQVKTNNIAPPQGTGSPLPPAQPAGNAAQGAAPNPLSMIQGTQGIGAAPMQPGAPQVQQAPVSPIIAHVQSPEFNNFMQSLTQNLNQNKQPS